MKGLEEAKALYESKGREMIRSLFPAYEGRIAVGLAGHGSECFGFDDELSRDHDFVPGFCLWLTDGDDLAVGARLAHAYRELVTPGTAERSAMGEKKLGVLRTSDFYRRYTGCSGAPESPEHWLSLPSWALAEATNGEVWRDDLGEFSAIRETLLHGMPEDVTGQEITSHESMAKLLEISGAIRAAMNEGMKSETADGGEASDKRKNPLDEEYDAKNA